MICRRDSLGVRVHLDVREVPIGERPAEVIRHAAQPVRGIPEERFQVHHGGDGAAMGEEPEVAGVVPVPLAHGGLQRFSAT